MSVPQLLFSINGTVTPLKLGNDSWGGGEFHEKNKKTLSEDFRLLPVGFDEASMISYIMNHDFLTKKN